MPSNQTLADENRAFIVDYFNALSGKPKSTEVIGKYVADEALARHIAESEVAFPKYELIIEDMVAEGDMVVVRAKFRGIHRGPFAGIQPTGKAAAAGLIIIYKVHNRKIVNHSMQFDMFSLLQQLQQTEPAKPEQSNRALVQRQLEAFARKDIDALVNNCASDCEFYAPGPEVVPYAGTMKGHTEIRSYFENLINSETNANLTIDHFFVQGNTVVVIGRYSSQVTSTGKAIQSPVSLTFEVRGDKFVKYTALADAVALASAHTQGAAAART